MTTDPASSELEASAGVVGDELPSEEIVPGGEDGQAVPGTTEPSDAADGESSTDGTSPTAGNGGEDPETGPGSATTTTAAPATTSSSSQQIANPGGRYWEWGWGMYDHGLPIETLAKFDWSVVNFGNTGLNESLVDHMNAVLQANPDHKFVLELWPTLGLGDSMEENRMQGTLFHYLYKEGVREAVHDGINHQVSYVLDRIDKPQNVVGVTFLEELPSHFTTSRSVLGWSRGEPMPWDIARFEDQINAELGEPIDMANEQHRLWWGEKYASVLREISGVMKQAASGREVLFWPSTLYKTLDMLDPGESMVQDDVVPIHYSQLLQGGPITGLFGYPNNDGIWQEETLDIANEFGLTIWSQVSTPNYMRAATWEDTIRLARTPNPENLGAFFYIEPGADANAWNSVPYADGGDWSVEDHAMALADIYVDS